MTPAEACAPLPGLRRLALRLTGGRPADAADLLQDTAERAVRACGRADPAHLTAWLATIMRNGALNAGRRPLMLALEEAPEPAIGAAGEAAVLLAEVAQRIPLLPAPYRQALLVALVMDPAEAAAALGLSYRVYRHRLAAARALLRGAVAGESMAGAANVDAAASYRATVRRARERGMAARRDGTPRNANPFARADLRRAWDAGWAA